MALSITFHQILVSVGDTVNVSQKIKEGEKERIQHFDGVIIAIKGNFGERTVTIRRIAAAGIGVEKIFPVDLPNIEKVTVVKRANVRRAKLYYIRQRLGSAPRVKAKKAYSQKRSRENISKSFDEKIWQRYSWTLIIS